jgi:inosine-uridine nucleoside N-ribohydrolase
VTTPRKIVIDTDPGIDDAMAIFYALASPELEVVGLTTIFGNVETELATTNALRLLEIAGRSDIPSPAVPTSRWRCRIAGGRVRARQRRQGDVFLPPPTTDPVDVDAADFLIRAAMESPGEITSCRSGR